jgi:hypothetical protein
MIAGLKVVEAITASRAENLTMAQELFVVDLKLQFEHTWSVR